MDDQACVPVDQDHDLDLDSFIVEDADVCSALTSPATLRSIPAVPAKEGRREETSQGQLTSSCATGPPKAAEEEEGPETPASAEKQASIIIRFGCHIPGQQCCVYTVAIVYIVSRSDPGQDSILVGHEQPDCTHCCLLNVLSTQGVQWHIWSSCCMHLLLLMKVTHLSNIRERQRS